MPKTDRLFLARDWVLAAISFLIALGLYVWTAAPNVTLLDSGEFIVAAQHFGVPHPTGYPLWTFLAWLFQFLPIGNVAHEIALFSGLCGALAVGLCTLLISSVIRWVIPDLQRVVALSVPLTGGLLFAFSEPLWSQATIAEVYTLFVLLVGLFFLSLYSYIRKPASDLRLLLSFFFLTLAFSNHHLALVLVPIPFLAVVLVRPKLFADLVIVSLLTATIFFLLFAQMSNDQTILKTSIRFAYLSIAAFVIFLWVRRLKIDWRLTAYLPIVVALGLAPYLYLPIASSTNPPMNWGYPRTTAGFYYTFNRSQYPNSLSTLIVGSVGRLLGTAPEESVEQRQQKAEERAKLLDRAGDWIIFFWQQIVANFTLLFALGFLCALATLLRAPPPVRCWIYVLNIALALAAFLQPIREGTETHVMAWWTQKPLHGYTFLIFALLSSIGVAYLFDRLSRRFVTAGLASMVILLLPLLTLLANYDSSSQRDRWFGWKYGYDMLKDLPEGAFVFGGTDPGRFIPTYMILGESLLPPSEKRDPEFDRRDLYIVTQNALADPMYQDYIHSHYTEARDRELTGFEKWLRRDEQYPPEFLKLPTADDVKGLMQETVEEGGEEAPGDAQPLAERTHGAIARWVFEQNKADRPFFVEESFPMKWSYDYAVPDGLLMRLHPEPLEEIPPEVVEADFAFWTDYITELTENPEFGKDFDAQRSFSQLRVAQGNLYRHRGMMQEAERAYRQALELWPANPKAAGFLIHVLWDRGEVQEPIEIITRSLAEDPNNQHIFQFAVGVVQRKELQGEIARLEETLARNPQQQESVKKLMQLLWTVQDREAVAEIAAQAEEQFAEDPEFLASLVEVQANLENTAAIERLLHQIAEQDPDNPDTWFNLARFYASEKRYEELPPVARRAISLGGMEYRERFLNAEVFKPLHGKKVFEEIFVLPDLGQLELAPAPASAPTPSESEASTTGGQEQKTLRSP